MLTQSKEVQNAWRASQRTLDIKVMIDGKTYGATDVNSLKYDSGAYNGDTFAIGSTYSNTVQIEFSYLVEGLKLGMEVRPSIGIKTSSGYIYEPLGVFIISSEIKMDRNNNLTTVSASDRFCGLEGGYVSKLTYPAKVLDVIAEICAQSGVKANTNDLARLPHQEDLPAPITGQSYRKALGWIAQLYVGYALFDRQGLFTIRTISEPNYELDPSQYEQAGLTKNEAAYKINGIQCQVTLTTKTRDGESTEETKTYQAGNATGSQIKLENNIMTPKRLNDIWEQLKDLTFYPFSLNWFGNPAVEAGDWLRLEDKQGNSFVVPNSSYTLDFNGGLSATSKADQTTSSDQMVPWQGNVAQTIKELKIRRSPDGTVVFPPSVTEPPTNAKFNDVWFKKNGNSTELWIFEKQDDGSGKWIRKDLSDDEIKKKVADAQQGLNQAKADIINNKQKADADIENLNKSIEDNKKVADQDIQNINKSIEVNKKKADQDIENLNKSIAANKKTADDSLQKLSDSITKLQGQYDNNIVPDLTKVTNDVADALQKYISAQNNIADLAKQAQQQGKDIADVSNTVKGLNINYANLAGDVNSTKVDVKGLQTTVGTANGDIAQLKLDAQNLQTMLAGKVDNTTYTNFVNLTNQALNARLTASDLNGYAKTADVQATANGLRVDLNSVTDRMNNLKVGTSNLLHHSDTFEGWHKGSTVSIAGSKYLNGTVAILAPGGSGVTALDAYLDGPYDNQPISWAVYAKADNAGNKLHTELWGGGGVTDQPLTTEWQVYKFTGQRDARDHSLYLWGCQGNKGNIYVALPFAVVGDAIGTWGPNASDIDHDLNELSARINVTNQQFSSYYTKLETDTKTDTAKNDAINAIKSDANWTGLTNIITNSGFLQSANGFVQKVQQTTLPMFDGGGLNLLRMSGFHNVTLGQLTPTWTISGDVSIDTGTVKTGAIEIDARGQRGFRGIQQQITVEPDTDYTFSMHLIGGEADSTFHAHTFMVEYDSDGKTTSPYVDHARDIVNAPQRSANTYTIHTSKNTHSVRLYIRAEAGSMIELEEIKLERGSVATPWTPNPADLATQSAFSELSQSLEGLRSTVGSNYGSLQSQISQSSSAVRTELIDKLNGVQNQITTTAKGLRVDLNSVTDRMNNLRVGTSNLLHHSDTFDGWHKGASVSVSSNKYLNGNIAVLKNTGSGGTALDADLDGPYDNQPISWAVYAKADNAGDKLHTELYGGGGFTDQPLTTEWQVYKFTGQRDARDHSFYLWGCQGNKGNIYIALPFAVVGNSIGTWGPNASDIDHDLEELSAQVNITNQQFSSYYTKSEADNRTNSAKNDAVNAIKSDSSWQGLNNILTNSGFLQTADGFLQKVQQTTQPMIDANNGGGINLLKKTNFANETLADLKDAWGQWFTLRDDKAMQLDALNSSTSTDAVQLVPVEPDTDYTLSFEVNYSEITKGGAWSKIRTYMVERKDKDTNTTNYVDHSRNVINTNKRQDNIYTIHTQKECHYLLVFFRAGEKTLFSFVRPKLEKGRVSTPYSPAPSDNVTQIAFTELTQSLDGLRSTVGSNYGSLQSQISQSSSSIRTELTDKIKGIDNKTTSTADSLNSVIGRVGSLENLTNFQVINNAINANDYTNTGNYFIQSTANTNVPGTDWCYLKVERVNDGRIVQTWQADIDPTLRYVRTKFGDSWTQWQRSASYSEYSELNRTVQGLQSTVSNNHGELQSQISQTAKTIRQEVSDKTNGLQTQINQQGNNFNVSLNSLRKETAWQKVTSAIDANNYKTTGNYWIQAAPNSNTPDSSAWAYLQVVAYPDVKRIKQTWQRDNNENEIYTRLLIENNWTSWQRTVTGGNIMAQINMSAGTTLIQNDKIYMDASSTVFSGKAFIPSAAITSLNADKITAGTINGAKVNVINLNANNITAGTLKGSNGEFYLDSGSLHVWQGDHNAWIDKNGIHDSDNSGNNVWISNGSISAYGNSSGAYLFDGGLYLHKSQSLSDAVLNPNYGSITKSDNIVSFGTSGLDIDGKDGFLLRTHGWNDQTLAYLNGNEIIGAGIAGKSDGFMNIAAKKQLFLYAGEPVQNDKLKTIPKLVLDGTYQNGQTAFKGTFSQYFFQGPSSGFSGGITLQDEFVNVGSLNGKNYFSISNDGAISITANGKSILSLNGLFPGVNGDFNVSGNFTVTGSKNAVVPTSRGMAAINAYETAEYYFGDIGETQTNSNGVVTVMIDPYFLETVNTLVPYQVFLTSYGDGNVWVSSRSANNFTVKSSEPNIHFAWEIKAKRKGYENDRMKIVKGVFNNEQY